MNFSALPKIVFFLVFFNHLGRASEIVISDRVLLHYILCQIVEG